MIPTELKSNYWHEAMKLLIKTSALGLVGFINGNEAADAGTGTAGNVELLHEPGTGLTEQETCMQY